MVTPSHAARLGLALEDARRAQGIKISTLSRKCHIPRMTLERRLEGDPNLKVEEFVHIAQALGLDFIRVWEDAIATAA